MKVFHSLLAQAIVLVILCVPVALRADEDIPGLLEKKKGPEARRIVTGPTIFRESKIPDLPVSQKQFQFLLDHPRLSNFLARSYDPALDAYHVETLQNGLIHVDDPPGLAGEAELVDSSEGRRIYYITGYFEVLKIRFNGQMVLITTWAEKPGQDASVDSTTASYIRVTNAIAGVFARVVAFIVPAKVDQRINRFIHAVITVVHEVHTDPSAAYRKLAVSPEVGKEELREFDLMFPRTGVNEAMKIKEGPKKKSVIPE